MCASACANGAGAPRVERASSRALRTFAAGLAALCLGSAPLAQDDPDEASARMELGIGSGMLDAVAPHPFARRERCLDFQDIARHLGTQENDEDAAHGHRCFYGLGPISRRPVRNRCHTKPRHRDGEGRRVS